MNIQEVIDGIMTCHPPAAQASTCDVIKYGNPLQTCTGIAITCFASVEVIRKAAEKGANLIICHEPLFYNHEDDTNWLAGDPVFGAKRSLLDETGIVVFRYHDYIHSGIRLENGSYADGIFYGIMQELGWADYLTGPVEKPLHYQIPQTSAEALAEELVRKLGLKGMRIVGDRHTRVSRVFIVEHVQDDDRANGQILQANSEGADALIPLELIDWTLSAYVRDAVQLGRPKVIFNIGHFNFEELGMKYVTHWLPKLLPERLPVHYIQSGDSFDFIL